MCLDTLVTTNDDVYKKKFGWKIFVKRFRSAKIPYRTLFQGYHYMPEVWCSRNLSHVKKRFLNCEKWPYDKYETGFHSFLNKKDALREVKDFQNGRGFRGMRKLVVKRVKLGGIVAKGRQWGYPIVVTKSIKIMTR